jgi:non-ribosomal peptide synthetase component E (peptide arylation enzyme)
MKYNREYNFNKRLSTLQSEYYSQVDNAHEDEDGNIHIDGWKTEDANEPGKVICVVSPEGKILTDDSVNDIILASLENEKVREAIQEAINRQEERKQELVDKVIEEQKEMMGVPPDQGDFTVIDELLKFIPCRNLMQSLDESEWKDYPTGWAEQPNQ